MNRFVVVGIILIAVAALLVMPHDDPESHAKAQEVIEKAIEKHGASHFGKRRIAFDFRGKHYTMQRGDNGYVYYREFDSSAGHVEDKLVNSIDFSRNIDGRQVTLSREWEGRYSRSVNSVFYFFEILYRLNDDAVIKTYEGLTTIEGESYHTIRVNFTKRQGGEDFQDEFYYWIHEKDYTLDYLAYRYMTDGGGIRFREAFDRERVGGITFQNYINYATEAKQTPLRELPELFAAGELKELSRIVNENIEVW